MLIWVLIICFVCFLLVLGFGMILRVIIFLLLVCSMVNVWCDGILV